jgi:serine protease Do
MIRLFLIVATLALPLLTSAAAAADSANPWVKPAELLQAATVTVRVTNEASGMRKLPGEPAQDTNPTTTTTAPTEPTPEVTICTGVCIGKGQIITAVVAASDSRIRLTLPGGTQAEAKVRVIDEYSGLTLLETDKQSLPALELATDKPAVGSGVLIASAWGTEQPVMAVGIVAANDRLLRGASFPPLMQCDIRISDTSAGAGLVNSEGKLLGIIVATDSPESRRDGGYAIPVSHLQRLLRMAARTDTGDTDTRNTEIPDTTAPKTDASQNRSHNGVIVMKRQRPIVGMRLEGDEDAIFVRHLTAGGPAEKAGLKVGDQVLATDGVAIRSVYQAVLPSLHKQPGDTMRFRIQREGTLQTIEVVLSGGLELSSAPRTLLSDLIQPQLQIGRDPSGAYVTRNRASHLAEVFAPADAAADEEKPAPTTAEKLALLEKALDRYRQVIQLQQQQIQALKDELKTEQTKAK